MPTIYVDKEQLFQEIGQNFTDAAFESLLFDYGLELDEIVPGLSISYKIEVPANRYDLLCTEGLSLALRQYLGICEVSPNYELMLANKAGDKPSRRILAHQNVAKVRPFILGAVVRNVSLDDLRIKGLIELQEKLHGTLCRRRNLVAIGVHDLDKLAMGDVWYTAEDPAVTSLQPLGLDREYTASKLTDRYKETASRLVPYLAILKDSTIYPFVRDADGVLSWPPIINSDRSKVTNNTRNLFIEATATDQHKAQIVLDVLCATLSQYCFDKENCIESVETLYDDGRRVVSPKMAYRTFEIETHFIRGLVGVIQPAEELCALLTKMAYKATPSQDGATLTVVVPPTRPDVLHACDIAEDVAIAYGYNKIAKALPATFAVAKQFELNKFSDQVRLELAMAGFTEVFTFALCSREDIAKKMGKSMEQLPAVHISNPKTFEFQVLRTSLIPGLLKCLANNRKMALPLKLFEVSDVVFKNGDKDVGAENRRHLAAVYCGKTSGFEQIHGLLDRIMQVLGVKWQEEAEQSAASGPFYSLSPSISEDETLLHGRSATILLNGTKQVGSMGVLHPNVLAAFELITPCSILEIDVEEFM